MGFEIKMDKKKALKKAIAEETLEELEEEQEKLNLKQKEIVIPIYHNDYIIDEDSMREEFDNKMEELLDR